ncbi:MAG: DegT/DnrJ/EryC1/StrS aminotransferase family protein [bacterium]|nr:DegT/DnrJ/EryC1/StrS aminotransferase family protein [bacterium]
MERVSFYKADITELEKNLVENVLESKILTAGPFIWRFQEEVRKYLKARYFLATSSGFSALHIAIRVLGWGVGDEVILSPLVHVGVPNTLCSEGVGIQPVDVEKDRLTLDPEKVREFIAKNYEPKNGKLKNKLTGKVLRGIILYHLYGIPCNIKEFLKLKEEFELELLEVCWESFGSSFKFSDGDVLTGVVGDVGVFSFARYGAINVGEGGGVAFKSEKHYKMGESLRYYGVPIEYVKYQPILSGYNYNLDEVSSAIGLGQMMRVSEILSKRERVYEFYRKEFKGVEEVKIVEAPIDSEVSWYSIVVILPEKVDRDGIIKRLMEAGIPSKVFYPLFTDLMLYCENCKVIEPSELHVAKSIAKRLLSLPFYGDLAESEVSYVVDSLQEALTAK